MLQAPSTPSAYPVILGINFGKMDLDGRGLGQESTMTGTNEPAESTELYLDNSSGSEEEEIELVGAGPVGNYTEVENLLEPDTARPSDSLEVKHVLQPRNNNEEQNESGEVVNSPGSPSARQSTIMASRAYQLEMFEESMKRNIIVAVRAA